MKFDDNLFSSEAYRYITMKIPYNLIDSLKLTINLTVKTGEIDLKYIVFLP